MKQQHYDPELQQKIRDYCDQIGSQEKAAKKIGVSGALLSQYLNSKYHEKGGDVSQVEEKLRRFFKLEEDASTLYIAQGYVPTSISQSVYQTIRICHLKGKMVSCLGDPGIGKTMGAMKYKSDYPDNCIIITMNPCFSNTTSCLRLLCNALRIERVRRQDDMWFAIAEKLSGSRKVIIIDEAQHLDVKTLDAIRSFYDANSEVGIALLGNVQTVSKRTNATGLIKESYKQIENRTRLTEILHTYQLSIEDAHLLFPALPEKEQGIMLSIMQSSQGIRGAVNTIELAVDNEDISSEGLTAAAEAVGALRSFHLW